ncbi:signal peptidase I [Streptacidiphilus pinicola]|uniref:Signal peptidase I n=1 Tax=Streptacidiphilus pinicola TaxID=2219663 RepID=A0A2X0IIF7_9ACTN|nr:signal peptidase I [Streptacidiphilus pinicola]RAG83383.1 signal peptidase I [Streptacidiphilus pinicola]
MAESGRGGRSLLRETIVVVGAALVIAVLVKTFFFQAFSIPSGSMNNTLLKGDRVLVDKFSPWFGATPARGDVVVFKDPDHWLDGTPEAPQPHPGLGHDVQSVLSDVGLMPSADDSYLIKRVIAVGGDTVSCQAGRPLRVDGVVLHEPYLYPGATPCDNDAVGTVVVPKGDLWVMGDHRNDSADSRTQRRAGRDGGFVPVADVVGRADVVVWPVGRWATLPEPDTFHQAGLPRPGDGVAEPIALATLVLLPLSGAALLGRGRRRRRGRA